MTKTQEKNVKRSLKELSDIKHALDVSSIVAMTDIQGRIIYVNDKFCETSKYSRKELIGKDHRVINSGYHPKEFFRDLWQTISRGKVWKGEIRNRAKDGSIYWVDTTIVPLLNEKKKPYQYVAIRNEITPRKEMEEAIKKLPQEIIQAQESERKRISREIHDDLGQGLATLKMLIQSSLFELDHNKTSLSTVRKKVLKQLDNIIKETRNLSAGLRPSTLEVLGVATSLKTLIKEFRKQKNVKIHTRLGRLDKVHLKGEAINLYRIVQEALTNIIKHAQATQIKISAKHADKTLTLIISDNGNGFTWPQKQKESSALQGLGLSTMSERAKLLGGSVDIQSKKGKGTDVVVTIPTKN